MQSALIDTRPLDLSLGKVLPNRDRDFAIVEEMLRKHMMVLGATGTGKSRFLLLLIWLLIRNYRSLCLIDPDGDLCDDIIAALSAYAERIGTDSVIQRTHLLELSPDVVFRHDFYRYSGPYPIGSFAHCCWLERRVEDHCKVILRRTQQGSDDFGVQVRLERFLRDYLYATAVPLDQEGNHLGWTRGLPLLDPQHGKHDEQFDLVSPHLPPEVVSDFQKIRNTTRPIDQERWLESTINRLRSLLFSLVKQIYSDTLNVVDFGRLINEPGQIVLVDMKDTEYFSPDQANAVGGLIIQEILSHARTRPGQRSQFYLVVDECWRFLADSLCRALAGHRKYGLSCILAAQHIGRLQNERVNMIPDIVENCRAFVTFQQSHPDHLELLAKTIGYGNVDFSELYQVVDRPDGYDWHALEEHSVTKTEQNSWQIAHGTTESSGTSDELTQSQSTHESWSRGESHQQGSTLTEGNSETMGYGSTHGNSETPLIADGRIQERFPVYDSHDSTNYGSGSSQSSSETHSQGTSSSLGGGTSETAGGSHGTSHSQGTQEKSGIGGSSGKSRTVSRKMVPLARHREEWHPTGRLRKAVADQFHRMMQQIHGLKTRQAVARLPDVAQAIAFEVHFVADPYVSANYKAAQIKRFKAKLFATHDYYIKPTLSAENESDHGSLPSLKRDGAIHLPSNGNGRHNGNGKHNKNGRNGRIHGKTLDRFAVPIDDPFEPT